MFLLGRIDPCLTIVAYDNDARCITMKRGDVKKYLWIIINRITAAPTPRNLIDPIIGPNEQIFSTV